MFPPLSEMALVGEFFLGLLVSLVSVITLQNGDCNDPKERSATCFSVRSGLIDLISLNRDLKSNILTWYRNIVKVSCFR